MITILAMSVAAVFLLADRWLSLPAVERAERREQLASMLAALTPRSDP